MVITVVVALIVTGAVLVPIIGGLTDNDNGGGSGEETVLATNSGEYYYNDVGKDAGAITYTFPTSLTEDDLYVTNIAVNGTSVLDYPMPEWADNGFDVGGTTVPLFIFKTADGKYGVEGVSAGGVTAEDGDTLTDAEEIKANAGLIYYRFILGAEDISSSFSFMSFLVDVMSPPPTVTIDNGTVSYSGFAEGDLEPLNGEYLLRLSDSKTEGDYCLADKNQSDSQLFVASDTEMYMWNIFGSVFIEVDEGSGDAIVNREGCTTLFGAGTVDTIASNSEAFNKWVNGLTFNVVKTTADNGLLSISSMEVGGNDQDYFGRYIVPTEIMGSSEGGSSDDNGDLGTTGTIMAVIPIFVILAILMYAVTYLRKPEY